MKKDMVSVINQLTSNEELAGYDTLKQILITHYNKFKFFYKYLKELDVDIRNLYCKEMGDELILYISTDLENIKYIYSHFSSIDNKKIIIETLEENDLIILNIKEKRRKNDIRYI